MKITQYNDGSVSIAMDSEDRGLTLSPAGKVRFDDYEMGYNDCSATKEDINQLIKALEYLVDRWGKTAWEQ